MFPTRSQPTRPTGCWRPTTSRASGASTRSADPCSPRHSGRCLDIEGISTANGADATQWEYLGAATIRSTGSSGWRRPHYRLIAQHSQRVIDVDAISTANGAQVHQWDWWGGDNQEFCLDPVGHGYYRIAPKHSGKSLDVSAHFG